MSIYFHGSFGLNRGRMAGIMRAAMENPRAKDAELASPFGYQAPFASKYRSWLHKTGIVERGLPFRPTQMGEVIWKYDPTFESLVTMAFMHHALAEPHGAPAWRYFVREFLPSHESFTRDDLVDGLLKNLRHSSENASGPGSQQVQVISRKLLECYTRDFALSELGTVRSQKNGFLRVEAAVPGPWQTVAQLEFAYKGRS